MPLRQNCCFSLVYVNACEFVVTACIWHIFLRWGSVLVKIDHILDVIPLRLHLIRFLENASEFLFIVLFLSHRSIALPTNLFSSNYFASITFVSGLSIANWKHILCLKARHKACVARNALVPDLMLRPTEPCLGVFTIVGDHNMLLGCSILIFNESNPWIWVYRLLLANLILASFVSLSIFVSKLRKTVAFASGNSKRFKLVRDVTTIARNLLTAIHYK